VYVLRFTARQRRNLGDAVTLRNTRVLLLLLRTGGHPRRLWWPRGFPEKPLAYPYMETRTQGRGDDVTRVIITFSCEFRVRTTRVGWLRAKRAHEDVVPRRYVRPRFLGECHRHHVRARFRR